MKNNVVYNNIKKILGVLLIILGIFGLFLPLLQGFLFITIGLLLLGGKPLLKKVKQLWEWLKKKFKKH